MFPPPISNPIFIIILLQPCSEQTIFFTIFSQYDLSGGTERSENQIVATLLKDLKFSRISSS